MIDRNLLRNTDWILIGILLLNSVLGVAFIYSTSHYLPGNYYVKQIFWMVFSSIALFLFLCVDYSTLVTYSFYLYLVLIGILGGILIFGTPIAGAKSWLKFPFFNVQPSEIAKIMIILLLANVFAKFRKNYLSMGKGFLGVSIIAVPVFLVALQPDLGTAFSYIPILLAALFLAGLNKKTIIGILICGLLLGIFGWNFGLKDYQKKKVNCSNFSQSGSSRLGLSYPAIKNCHWIRGFFRKRF